MKSLLNISNYTNAYDNEFIGFVRRNKSDFKKSFRLKSQINETDLNYIIANRLNNNKYFEDIYDFQKNIQINDSKNTYDGSHYYKNFISLIADFMEGSELLYGLKINNFDFEDKYKEMFSNIKKIRKIMLFNSYQFLFIFLPIALLIYYFVNLKKPKYSYLAIFIFR